MSIVLKARNTNRGIYRKGEPRIWYILLSGALTIMMESLIVTADPCKVWPKILGSPTTGDVIATSLDINYEHDLIAIGGEHTSPSFVPAGTLLPSGVPFLACSSLFYQHFFWFYSFPIYLYQRMTAVALSRDG